MNFPTFKMLCGLPGSGKSTFARMYRDSNDIIMSSNAIRKELYGDASIQGDPNEVFRVMNTRTCEHLHIGHSVIYDATNITRKARASILNMLPKYVEKKCGVIWAPIELCIERDSERERTVGKDVIDRMVRNFQPPFYDEGFDLIFTHVPSEFIPYEYKCQFLTAMEIPHDNHHHTTKTIREHCEKAKNYILDSSRRYSDCNVTELIYAAMYHDVGKPYVKDFKNSSGEPTEEAHYYNHQNVGAYLSYGCADVLDDPHNIAWMIGAHMDPFLDTKYYRNLPSFLKRNIDILHEADLAAH